MSFDIYDAALAAGMLAILAVAAVLWLAQALAYHRRLRTIRRNSRWPSVGHHPSYFMPSRRWPVE